MKEKAPALLIAFALFCFSASHAAPPGDDAFFKYTNHNPDLPGQTIRAADFVAPSGFAKPQTWWHWINGNVSREGIEADLREMSEKGYGFARIFHINNKLKGPITFNTPEWFDMFRFATQAAAKHDMGIGIHNCDGWSEAGGPWITPELSMKELTLKTVRVAGNGAEQSVALPALDGKLDFARDIAVLAWPAKRPASIAMHRPGLIARVYPSNEYTKSAPPGKFDMLFDGLTGDKRVSVSYEKDSPEKFCGITLEFTEPFEAAGVFTEAYWMYELPLNIFLECSDDGVRFEKVRELKFRQADIVESFAPRKAKYWRIVRYQSKNPTERVLRGVVQEHIMRLSELELLAPGESSRAASAIENFKPKAGAAHASGVISRTAAPFPEKLILRAGDVRNLTADFTAADDGAGTLRWRVPGGEWIVMRIGYTTTGKVVHPASEAGRGLEVDKFEPDSVAFHFNAYDKKMIEAAGPLAGNVFSIIETDSWEAGNQNWTQNFERYFREQNGYDILPWLPVYAGECIESVDTTEKFLQDLRRTFSSLVMNNFYGKLGSMIRAGGLKYETEPAGEIFMRSPMNSFREADYPMTEVWQDPREPGLVAGIRRVSARETASTAHFYGKKYVTCEALTSRKGNWAETPWIMKGTLDTLLLAGPNVSVFHTYAHQPDERAPGWQMDPWGVSQNRKMPWWPFSKDWFSYIARTQYMLQQGKYATRMLYLYSDEIPTSGASMRITGNHQYDVIEGDGAQHFLRVENGELVSPGRMRYKLLVVSPNTSLRLETLETLKKLLEAGATISIEKIPAENFTLRGGAETSARWRALAAELFGNGDKTIRRIGKGSLYAGHTPDEMTKVLGLREPFTCALDGGANDDDIAWIHREHAGGAEWFWLINRESGAPRSGIMSFAVTGKHATIWRPETGAVEPVPALAESGGRTLIPMTLGKLEGVFVVFENKPPPPAVASKIIADGKQVFPKPDDGISDNTKISGDFTFAVTVSPTGNRKITQAAASGIAPGGGGNENFVLYPEQMHNKLNDMKHACAGLSVGRNSVAVFEHGAGYLNSIIVWDHPVAENTQVAVVYKNNTPALYINGKQVAAAQKPSGRIVHPPAGIRAEYNGRAADYILETPATAQIDNTKISGDFTFAVTVSPTGNRKITQAAASGIAPGGGGNENFVLYPEQMHNKLNDMKHACAGLSVGRNSVAVFEHGAGYLNSIIVWDHPVAENTHVAVVYKNNTPALYINGKQVAAAQKPSGRIVHPPAAIRAEYVGRAGDFSVEKFALDAAEIAARATAPTDKLVLKTKPAAAAGTRATPRLFITRDGKLAAEFAAPGKLEIKKSGGAKITLTGPAVPEPKKISGPYAVSFDSKWGAPAGPQQFDKLVSWTESSEPGVKHYSGAAVYAKTITLDARDLAPDRCVYLEIDQVCEVAEVTLNGKRAGTLWRPPYKIDVTEYVKAGDNALRIAVANTWVNRCLYDASLPEAQRLTWANSMQTHYPDPKTIKPSDFFPWKHGPLPSGLIGEMKLTFTKIVSEK